MGSKKSNIFNLGISKIQEHKQSAEITEFINFYMQSHGVGVVTSIPEEYCTVADVIYYIRAEYGIPLDENIMLKFIRDAVLDNNSKLDLEFADKLHEHITQMVADNVYKTDQGYQLLFNKDYIMSYTVIVLSFLLEYFIEKGIKVEEEVGAIRLKISNVSEVKIRVSLISDLLDDIVDVHTVANTEVFRQTAKLLRKYYFAFTGISDNSDTNYVRKF